MLAPILSFFFAQNSRSIFGHNARTEHNFEHIAMILRVTLKSMMLKFSSIIYLTLPGSGRYFREPGFDQNKVRELGKRKLYLDEKWDLTAPVKRDSSKLGHGMRDFLLVCWEFRSCTNGKCESSRCALSGASYRSKLYRVILVMIISMKLSSNQQTSGQKTSSFNLMSEKYQV